MSISRISFALFLLSFDVFLVYSILIPNGGSARSCECPAVQPCPALPPQTACPALPPATPCACAAARSGGKTYSTASGEQKLINLASKEIRRSPQTNTTESSNGVGAGNEVLRVSASSNNTTFSESADAVSGDQDEESKCNSQVLKKLMVDNINVESSNDSKRSINAAAEHKFGGVIDVICSRGHFSYVYTSSLFCETSRDDMTCIAFRQVSNTN